MTHRLRARRSLPLAMALTGLALGPLLDVARGQDASQKRPAKTEDGLYLEGSLAVHAQNFAEGEELFAELIERFPAGRFAEEAQYWRAHCFEGLGAWANARRIYQSLAKVENSPWAKQAQRRLQDRQALATVEEVGPAYTVVVEGEPERKVRVLDLNGQGVVILEEQAERPRRVQLKQLKALTLTEPKLQRSHTLVLKSGDRISGRVQRVEPERLVIQQANGDQLLLTPQDVLRLAPQAEARVLMVNPDLKQGAEVVQPREILERLRNGELGLADDDTARKALMFAMANMPEDDGGGQQKAQRRNTRQKQTRAVKLGDGAEVVIELEGDDGSPRLKIQGGDKGVVLERADGRMRLEVLGPDGKGSQVFELDLDDLGGRAEDLFSDGGQTLRQAIEKALRRALGDDTDVRRLMEGIDLDFDWQEVPRDMRAEVEKLLEQGQRRFSRIYSVDPDKRWFGAVTPTSPELWEGRRPDVDRVYLENGDVVSGEVLTLDKEHLTLEASWGEVKIDRDQVARIAFQQRPKSRTRRGTMRLLQPETERRATVRTAQPRAETERRALVTPSRVVIEEDAEQEARPAGYLGVQLDQTQEAPVLAEVIEGGPAAQGGLKAGDRILSVTGKQTKTRADLVEAITARKPGAKVEVNVERTGGIFTSLTIELGQRADR